MERAKVSNCFEFSCTVEKNRMTASGGNEVQSGLFVLTGESSAGLNTDANLVKWEKVRDSKGRTRIQSKGIGIGLKRNACPV